MTHDELMQATRSLTYMNSRTLEHPYLVIRAVLELHKPHQDPLQSGINLICLCCTPGAERVAYPCLTIQALEAELNA